MLRRFCMMRRLIQLRLAVFAAMGFAAVRSATSRRCRVGGSMVCTTTRCYGMGTTCGGSSV
jgi:hypothetical protein